MNVYELVVLDNLNLITIDKMLSSTLLATCLFLFILSFRIDEENVITKIG